MRIYRNSTLEKMQRCPRLGYYTAELGLQSTAVAPKRDFGTAIHAAMAIRFRSELAGNARRDIYELAQHLRLEQIFEHVAQTKWQSLGRAKEIVSQFNDDFPTLPFLVRAVEREWEFDLSPGIRYSGTLDAVVEDAGALWVWDIKTSSSQFDHVREHLKWAASAQQQGYLYTLSQLYHASTKLGGYIIFHIHVPSGPGKVAFTPFQNPIDLNLLEMWRERTIAVIKEWEARRDYPHYTSMCSLYGTCEFYSVCHETGERLLLDDRYYRLMDGKYPGMTPKAITPTPTPYAR